MEGQGLGIAAGTLIKQLRGVSNPEKNGGVEGKVYSINFV